MLQLSKGLKAVEAAIEGLEKFMVLPKAERRHVSHIRLAVGVGRTNAYNVDLYEVGMGDEFVTATLGILKTRREAIVAEIEAI